MLNSQRFFSPLTRRQGADLLRLFCSSASLLSLSFHQRASAERRRPPNSAEGGADGTFFRFDSSTSPTKSGSSQVFQHRLLHTRSEHLSTACVDSAPLRLTQSLFSSRRLLFAGKEKESVLRFAPSRQSHSLNASIDTSSVSLRGLAAFELVCSRFSLRLFSFRWLETQASTRSSGFLAVPASACAPLD